MQFILDQAEYNQLKAEEDTAKIKLQAVIMGLCTKVCDNMPTKFWNNEDARIWGCFKSKPSDGYCDCCPVQTQCPEPNKRWSK